MSYQSHKIHDTNQLQNQYNYLHEQQRQILRNLDKLNHVQFEKASKKLDQIKQQKQYIKFQLHQQQQYPNHKLVNAQVFQINQNYSPNITMNQSNETIKYNTNYQTYYNSKIIDKYQPQVFPYDPFNNTYFKIDKKISSQNPEQEELHISQVQYTERFIIGDQKNKIVFSNKNQSSLKQIQQSQSVVESQQNIQTVNSQHSNKDIINLDKLKKLIEEGNFNDQIHPKNLSTEQLFQMYQEGIFDEILNDEQICESERDLLEEIYIRKILKKFFPDQKMNYGAIHFLIQKDNINQSDYQYLQDKIYKKNDLNTEKQNQTNQNFDLIKQKRKPNQNSEQFIQSQTQNKDENTNKNYSRQNSKKQNKYIQMGSKYDINIIEEEPSQEFETSKYQSKEEIQDTLTKLQKSKEKIQYDNYSYNQLEFQSSDKKNLKDSALKKDLEEIESIKDSQRKQTPRFKIDLQRDQVLKDSHQKLTNKKFEEDDINQQKLQTISDSQQLQSIPQTNRDISDSNGVSLIDGEKIQKKDLQHIQSNRSLQFLKSKNFLANSPQNIFKQKLSPRSYEEHKIYNKPEKFDTKNLLSNSSKNEKFQKSQKFLHHNKNYKIDTNHTVSDSELFVHNFSFRNQLLNDKHFLKINIQSQKDITTNDLFSEQKVIEFLKLKIDNLQQQINQLSQDKNQIRQIDSLKQSQNFFNEQIKKIYQDQAIDNSQQINNSIQNEELFNSINKYNTNKQQEEFLISQNQINQSREFVNYTIGKQGDLVSVFKKKISLEDYDFTQENHKQKMKEIEAKNLQNLKDFEQRKQYIDFKNKHNMNNQIKKQKFFIELKKIKLFITLDYDLLSLLFEYFNSKNINHLFRDLSQKSPGSNQ